MTNATTTYPALMAYIMDRNTLGPARDWCDRLREDQDIAVAGGFADVAAEMERARADYAAQQAAKGQSGFPYNSAMGEYLGLPLKGNHEPEHGYYMASCVATSYRLGVAQRAVAAMIQARKPLRLVAARAKTDGKPVRFVTLIGPAQIQIEWNTVVASNGKKRWRLSSNWSTETCLERVAEAMRAGHAYGEAV